MEQCEIDNQLFHMFDGSFRALKDLKVGDELMSDDSTSCTVQNILITEEETYSVTPVKGDTYFISASDTLCLYCIPPHVCWAEADNGYKVTWFDKIELRYRGRQFHVNKFGGKENCLITAETFKDSLDKNREFSISVKKYLEMKKSSVKDIKSFKVPLSFPDRKFTFDPYFIGYWLGDGSKSGAILTIGDEDKHMVEYFAKYFKDNFDMDCTKNGISYRFKNKKVSGKRITNVLKTYLREKNILDNKHIPIEFLHSSRESRLRLLAGLIDSDGHLHGNTFDFIQKLEGLFDDVIYLCRSLGFSCYKVPCEKICTNAPGGPKTGNYFRCQKSGK
jgi:replicative DNA helicase